MEEKQKAIEAIALCKNYGNVKALQGLDIEVEKGEIYGFLGHNGAGKTSFMKILIGLCHPSSGHVKLFGEKISTQTKKRIGFLPERVSIPGFLKAREFLVYCAKLQDQFTKNTYLQIDEILEKVGLKDVGDEKTAGFSKGMLQRLGLAQCILGHPEILLLDEPGSGLDPQGIIDFRNLILEENRKRNVTIFLNSHRLLEAEKICTRVGILQKGQLVASGSIENLTRGKNQIRLKLENWTEKLQELMKSISVEYKFPNETEVIFEPKESLDIAQIPKIVVETGGNILHYERSKESLEEIFMRVTGGNQ
jgi:ABC-2 type transport system ATP-binding protein